MSIKDANNLTTFHNHEEFLPKEQEEILRIQALWKAVIMQAFTDASSNSRKKCMRMIKSKAISWLQSEDNEDLLAVCAFANIKYQIVKDKVKEILGEKKRKV